ncbi:dinuclear metal center protein, YbgI/SA1388 family [Flavobacteriaceae bacterium MAR_2010_188]|nr:dinuclear metal center protein, YbgI/SA1388 family [Flavobacteriaceae bacterium MAR_2010_188]
MKISEVIALLEELAPLKYAEDFDNVGLLVGDKNLNLKGILVTLDTLESVIDEAIEKDCNLIVSFHPIIFKGLKKLNGSDYVERTLLKAIKNDISIYAIHTALDNSKIGVNNIICERLGLTDLEILLPKSGTIKKLTTYVPAKNAENVKQELFKVGAGSLGNYEHCSFTTEGKSSFRGNDDSNPTVGNKHEYREENETLLAISYPSHLEGLIIKTLNQHHPYEEVAFEILTLENQNQNIGMGMVGNLENEMEPVDFLNEVKTRFNLKFLRHSELVFTKIKRVAVLGGSGSFAISAAKKAKAEVFLTAELKYHDFFSAENQIILADIGHYESEQFTKTFLSDYLSKKITNFAVVLSTTDTNPVKYL